MRIQLFTLSFSSIPSLTVVIVSWLCKKYVILFQLGPVYKKYSWRFDSIRTMSKIVRVRVFFILFQTEILYAGQRTSCQLVETN